MSLRAIAWDVDGTLIDSEPLHLRALLTVAAKHGADLSDLPDEHFIGLGLDGVWQEIGGRFPASLGFDAWIAAINGDYVAQRDSLPVPPETPALVARIAAAGLVQVAVSNSHRCIVDANLDVLGIGDHLAFSLSLDDVPVGKPDPTPYRLAAERLGLTPGDVLVVEDSASGLASARAAGCITAGLAADHRTWPQADHTIRRLAEIPGLLAALGVDLLDQQHHRERNSSHDLH